jgi:hypothetical protein
MIGDLHGKLGVLVSPFDVEGAVSGRIFLSLKSSTTGMRIIAGARESCHCV